jgi:hypothetical protein
MALGLITKRAAQSSTSKSRLPAVVGEGKATAPRANWPSHNANMTQMAPDLSISPTNTRLRLATGAGKGSRTTDGVHHPAQRFHLP